MRKPRLNWDSWPARAMEPSALAGEAIRAYLRSAARHEMEQEAQAFRRLHPDLLATIPGQYAAVYHGQLVDHDEDQLALYQRIEARLSGLPVLIRQVRPEVETTIDVLNHLDITLRGPAGVTEISV